jgi:hypothetical protein
MHTYRRVAIPGKHDWEGGSEKFEVGYWHPPSGDWIALSTHTEEKRAIIRVNALNGGDGNPAVWCD